MHLDIYLLKLLFNADKNVNKEVRKKALELILSHLNLRNSLKKELQSIEFLSVQAERDLFIKINTKSKHLYAIIKNMTSLQFEKNTKSSYNILLKEASVATLEMIQLYKKESQSDYQCKKFQSILRHTNFIEPLLKIMQLNSESHKVLYKSSIRLLYYFVYENMDNQELLLPYVDLFLGKIEIGLGVTKLLAEILSGNTKLRKGNRIIRLIFESIDKSSYEYHLLQLLRTFVYDKNKELIQKMQIDVLK